MSTGGPKTPPVDWRLPADELEQDPLELFDKVEKLGEGSYGSVYKAIHKATGYVCAVKEVALEDDFEDLIKEISIMKQLCSANIVNYYGSFVQPNELWIVMEYCSAGSIADIMGLCKASLKEEQIACVMKDTLQGLEYLHSMNKIHRDIKAGNILVNDKGEGKLADFGVSGQLKDADAKRNTVIGTPYWMAPEVIQEIGYNCAVDVWSLGITCIEMADQRPPLCNIHPMRAIFMIPARPPPTLTKPEDWSPEFNDFIASCLVKDPAQRLTATQLLQHRFITKSIARESIHTLIREAGEVIVAKGRLHQDADSSDDDTLATGTIVSEPKSSKDVSDARPETLVKLPATRQAEMLKRLDLAALRTLLTDIEATMNREIGAINQKYEQKKAPIVAALHAKTNAA